MDNNFKTVFNCLQTAFPGGVVKVNGRSGSEHYAPQGKAGNHLKIEVVWPGFQNLPLLEQHRQIHDALADLMQINGGFIHALTIKTRAPQKEH